MEAHTLHLSGVEVEFPFKPYPCQLSYMEKVIQALQQNTNAILESPTGTGKTLCLLCAALGWREDLVKKLRLERGEEEEGRGRRRRKWIRGMLQQGAAKVVCGPRIIYASRTHSQLSQVIHELKNTKYRPKVAIIGSREQLCVHPEVSKKETNAEKVHLCRAKVKSHACFYYNNLDIRRLRRPEDPVMDIEDLVLVGSRQKMCPYYLARELKSEADIIFMPYNYILDIKTRQIHGIDVEGTVVILDEAHNIERVCEDSASFDLTSTDLAYCIGDVDNILKSKYDSHFQESAEEGDEEDLQDYLNVKEFLLHIEAALDAVEFPEGKQELVKPGEYIFDFFKHANLTHSTSGTLLEQLSKVISFLTTAQSSLHRNANNIQKIVDVVKMAFNSKAPPTAGGNPAHSSYKVYIKCEESQGKAKKSDAWTVSAADTARKDVRTVSYWCFSPGHAMSDLVKQGVRSVILTSGTLSPLDSFSSELRVDFPIRYEGPHVISEKQIWVGVISKGCDGIALNSSYANRSSISYQTSLGNTLVNFSRSIPHGLLVFFPSYPVMNACVESWRECGILQRIELNKPVFLEPRRKVEFNSTMDAFYQKITDPKHNGAAFFAVCRGKVSEGLDFADMNGRAVVITGLPYPPRMDPKVKLKMQYLQDTKQFSNGLSGEEWYKQQASRAVNQAVGRVIRHRLDYGAILLCDERFCYPSALNQLPQWIRPHVQTYTKFGMVQRDINLFFKNAVKEFGPEDSKVSAAGGGAVPSSSSTSSIRLPIVAKVPLKGSTASYKQALKRAQNASEVDIHVPSKIMPTASLKRRCDMTEEAASEGLISSLSKSEAAPKPKKLLDLYTPPELVQNALTTTGPSFSASIMQEAHARHHAAAPPHSTSSTSSSAATNKKILVLSKEKKKEARKTATVQEYLKKVKESLSNEGYDKFKESMIGYKKKRDISIFAESLKGVFPTPSLFPLLEDMSMFVLEEHEESFSRFYQSFTGKPLKRRGQTGTTKRKTGPSSSSKDHPKVKVQKTEQPVVEGLGGGGDSKQLSTGLLASEHCLDSRTHLNRGKSN